MRGILLLASALLFFAMLNLPIGYYTFLRIAICICAVIAIYNGERNLAFWPIVFGAIAILFNPIIPVYFHNKYIWSLIDAVAGLAFLIKAFLTRTPVNNKTDFH